MSLKYLIDTQYIPDDGAKEVIETFEKNTGADILVFPDVHMKRGALIANGMLVSSPYSIFLSCLGVENCGFTFGKINENNVQKLIKSFEKFSCLLRDRSELPFYSKKQIIDLFDEYLDRDYKEKHFLYNFLGYSTINELLDAAHIVLDDKILTVAAKSLCTLGGGNHFFEIHRVVETYEDGLLKKDDYVYMLHSDSISVGDTIYELYSDLHEMNRTGSLREKYRVAKFKMYQRKYFKSICKKINGIESDLFLMFKPKDDYQAIDIRTPLGKILMLAHNLSSLFGEMNRDAIIKDWSTTQGIHQEKISSHSHDNVSVEMHNGQIKIVHRNGVQNIGKDPYCILPSAMGDFSYVMKNTYNNDAYFSTNHGTGRMQDKHIAREHYTETLTIKEMEERNVALFRVGNGNLAEQNMHAFKEPAGIIQEMERNKLAKKAAKTYPIAVIKG